MSNEMFIHSLKRSLREQIEKICDEKQIVLAENVMQNVIHNRIRELADFLASGIKLELEERVMDAWSDQEQGKAKAALLGIDMKPPPIPE